MSIHLIPSVLHGRERAYKLNSDWGENWNQRGERAFDLHLTQYQTYGDGTTQHSGEWIAQVGEMEDICLSLAQAIAQDPRREDWGAFYGLLGHWHSSVIEFALSVCWKEGKPQWYCLADRKVSTSPSKAHDRRWEQVPEWANTTNEGAFRLLWPLYGGPSSDWSQRIMTAHRIVEFQQQRGTYTSMANTFPALKDIEGEWLPAWEAFCLNLTAAWSLHHAQRMIDSVVERHTETPAAKAA